VMHWDLSMLNHMNWQWDCCLCGCQLIVGEAVGDTLGLVDGEVVGETSDLLPAKL
jgi:hypothetical protein